MIRVRFCAPLCMASMCCANMLCIFPSLPLSLRALMSCSPMHIMYTFFGENVFVPNMSCGSCVIAFDILASHK